MNRSALCRALHSGDVEAITAIHAQGFDQGWSTADMADHIERDIVIGIDAPLAGFIIIRAAVDQAEVLTITICPSKRGQGYGAKLLSYGENEAARSGVDIIFLEVAEDNISAIALYRKLGYQPIGRRPGYYKRPGGRVAALTFRKNVAYKALDAAPSNV